MKKKQPNHTPKKRTTPRSEPKYLDLQNASKGKERELVARYGPIASAHDDLGEIRPCYYTFRYVLNIKEALMSESLYNRLDYEELRDAPFNALIHAIQEGDLSFFEALIDSVKAVRSYHAGRGHSPIAVAVLDAVKPKKDCPAEKREKWESEILPTATELLEKIPSASLRLSQKRTLQRILKVLKLELRPSPNGRPPKKKRKV